MQGVWKVFIGGMNIFARRTRLGWHIAGGGFGCVAMQDSERLTNQAFVTRNLANRRQW